MSRVLTVAAVLALAATGCSKQHPADKVTYVSDDDPRMNAAIETARSTVNIVINALKSPQPGQSMFSIKAPVTDGGNTEHLWLTPVSYDGTNFEGTINNEPEMVKNVKMGQKVTVAPSKISDWMYVENQKLVGGYTLRALRNTLTPAERVDFDKTMPFVIE